MQGKSYNHNAEQSNSIQETIKRVCSYSRLYNKMENFKYMDLYELYTSQHNLSPRNDQEQLYMMQQAEGQL